MIGLNRPSTKYSIWRTAVSVGLLLLIALVINLLGTGEALAHSSISVDHIQQDHSNSGVHSPADLIKNCHHQNGTNKTTAFKTLLAHRNHEGTSHQEKHDCNTCCPFEINGSSSAYLRSKHDHDWLALPDHHDQFANPVDAANGSITLHDTNHSKRLASQLNGLSGAQAQFLHTIRLLT
jgi:hypothetical protein